MANDTGYKAVTQVPTTGNTATTLASFPLAELETIMLSAYVSGMKTDATGAAARFIQMAFARREASGNITLVDSVQYGTLVEDSAAAATITADVDTATQTMRIRVAGITAESWVWDAYVMVSYS